MSFSPDAGYAFVLLIGRVLLAALFLYLYRIKRERYLLFWTLGWTLLAVHYLAQAQVPLALPAWLESVGALALVLGGLLFFDSARVFINSSAGPLGTFVAPVFVLWLLLHATAGIQFRPQLFEIAAGGAAVATALLLVGEGRRREMIGGTLLGMTFLLWGLLYAGAGVSELALGVAHPREMWLFTVPEQLLGIGMLIVLYEEERRNFERHMLSLAGLNLITSTTQHAATLQDMLGQTLERLLGALRVPAGTVALALGDDRGLSSLHRGVSGGFLREAEQMRLVPYLHQTVARLGGLLVLPDLNSPGIPAAFARDSEFQRLAELARAERIRLLVGVCLRAKTGDHGVLLLASPDSRRFTPAELRLLLGLGGQIGMAVENFQLLQQGVRRTEELRLLNEIGRALSSTLSVDELLERIHAEMRKVLDVSNFYIALFDPRKDEVSFELEVKDGHFLPKRRRHARNGLTEYVLRRREPVLIRSDFHRVMTQLGVEPGRSAQSFCAVPILLHGDALGVIGIVSYEQENVFDQQHVEVLTILAAQTAVAIENARLFRDEQRRGQQLALLNNVSRKAISTLDPGEMLTAVAAEIYSGIPADHVGLGVVDYASREIVIQAEGGHGAQGLNRRFKFGEGGLGQVAVTGALHHVDDTAETPNPAASHPVLADARSVVVVPIAYADQLLGVMNVESRKPRAFREEDILLLRTLADVVASALSNALAFQKAREQAITDGLTGLKTHRFFMEALNGEWRRATRAGRHFSLVLIDLDRFKFVNDYFGHLEGDTVLQRVARILEQNVRRSDVVARYGGDEFVVLMPEANAEQAYLLGEKLRHWVANDPLLREKKITASIGIATYPQYATTPQELIQIADASMYLAKHQGGNLVVSADHYKVSEQKQWQRHVLEAYLGVTIKRLYSTGPEAFEEVYQRLVQIVDSLGAPGAAQEIPPAVLDTVTSLAFAIDAKDHYTQGHSQNVARYCVLAARRMKLAEKEVEEIRLAALLHDVGKIGIPESILNKPAPLEPDEYTAIKEHAVLGARILEPLRALKSVQSYVRHHHERWDGKGYPDGLAAEKTPLPARLISIADAFDTMISERTYKRARSRIEAFEELRRCAGEQFDPKLVDVFVEAVASEVGAEGELPPVARA